VLNISKNVKIAVVYSSYGRKPVFAVIYVRMTVLYTSPLFFNVFT